MSSRRQPKFTPPFVYFLDRCLGRGDVATGLRSAGCRVEVHDDHFAQNVTDIEWLREVGKRKWIVLTKDKNIRVNQLERQALIESNVAAFMIGKGDLKARTIADLVLRALPLIERALHRFRPAIIATITASGSVRVLIADSGDLTPPCEYTPKQSREA